MASSQARRERRLALQAHFASNGGYGTGNNNSQVATGNKPGVSPFMIPKQVGLNIISKHFPDNYYVDWSPESWRQACDQAQKQGLPVSYSALANWAFEASTFIQSLFVELGDGILKIPCNLIDPKTGNVDELWTEEICNKRWVKDLRKEIAWSRLWGFEGINMDPLNNRIYKYPMSQLDPINRMLRYDTYNYNDGLYFDKTPNLLFLQPSTSYEAFLGWMQPITRAFILMNQNSMNWVQAGRRLTFPLLTIGYPAASTNINDEYTLENPFKAEAENYISNVDPSKALAYPYTRDREGNIQKAFELDIKETSAKQNIHKIYQEFNTDEKNSIRELVFGGTLTSDAGKFGTKGLGDVHEGKYDTAIRARSDEVLDILNDETDFLWKIKKFYTNFPDNLRFSSNESKSYGIDEVKLLSDSMSEMGLQLTPKFFIKYGLDEEDIQEAPKPITPSFNKLDNGEETELSVSYDKPGRSLLGLKKKY
jgi:hypothetical protein